MSREGRPKHVVSCQVGSDYSSVGQTAVSGRPPSVPGWQKIRSKRAINHVACFPFFFFFHVHIFFLPSVFVAGLRPEGMAAVLHGCGGRSQTKCQLGRIVAAIKAPPPPLPPSGTVWVRPRCTLGLWDGQRRRTGKAVGGSESSISELIDVPTRPVSVKMIIQFDSCNSSLQHLSHGH